MGLTLKPILAEMRRDIQNGAFFMVLFGIRGPGQVVVVLTGSQWRGGGAKEYH